MEILATPVAGVAGALYPGQDHLVRRSLGVLGETQEAHQVDETGGEVQLAAELAGCVVVRERVVIVVESLACGEQEARRHKSKTSDRLMFFGRQQARRTFQQTITARFEQTSLTRNQLHNPACLSTACT